MLKKINLAVFLALVLLIGFYSFRNFSLAQKNKVDYGNGLVLDSDLDGLTDKGEQQIFNTDPNNPDSDGDGIYDGAEAMNHTDPNDPTSPVAIRTVTEFVVPDEIPWPWYVVRASGLIGFALLYIVMFFGLAIRIPTLNQTIKPIDSLNTHRWLSMQAFLFILLHVVALLFDKYIKFNLRDVFIPFASSFNPTFVAMGILGFYLMIILIITSYFRNKISHRLWRIIHWGNVVLFVMAIVHSLYLGTDLKEGMLRAIFIGINVAMGVLILLNIFFKIKNSFRRNVA